MFERFTDRARRVLVLAQEEARLLNSTFIGTEHLLLGLVHEGEGVAFAALTTLGITLDDLRQEVKNLAGPPGEPPSESPQPFTPRFKKVLDLALREALQLGHNYIGTEHILLGLIREGEGVAAQALVQLGADLSRTRQQVITMLAGQPDRSATRTEGLAQEVQSASEGSLVDDGSGVVSAEFPFDPHELITRKDVESLLRDAVSVRTMSMVSWDTGTIEHRRCSYEPRLPPTVSISLAGAGISSEAFARNTGPERFRPVEDLGDAAVFDALTSSVRVLCGSVVFSVAVDRHRDPYGAAIALARKAVGRLNPPG